PVAGDGSMSGVQTLGPDRRSIEPPAILAPLLVVIRGESLALASDGSPSALPGAAGFGASFRSPVRLKGGIPDVGITRARVLGSGGVGARVDPAQAAGWAETDRILRPVQPNGLSVRGHEQAPLPPPRRDVQRRDPRCGGCPRRASRERGLLGGPGPCAVGPASSPSWSSR